MLFLIVPKCVSSAFIQALSGKLLKTNDKSTRRDTQKELRTLSKEERKRQQLAVSDVLKNADVMLTTLTGAFSHKLDNTSFDLVIIDEAALALEIACWIFLLKVVLLRILKSNDDKLKDMEISTVDDFQGNGFPDKLNYTCQKKVLSSQEVIGMEL
ncbi:hypothetical protein DKX38_023806 [Salix brachista]|uniref:DNA2/NAM7 helicase helicase domain-containing protein n=1 Tax=Salix brachista TaxID=2182728 RepID=A0A5N5JXJ1_9ROSI|nr:hypothetical protein DKX38_023806 [Salix brachista]